MVCSILYVVCCICGVVGCGVMLFGVVWYGVVRCDIFLIWYGVNAVMYFGMIWYVIIVAVVWCSRVVVSWFCDVV